MEFSNLFSSPNAVVHNVIIL